jgi:hypothetical protein
MIMKEFDHLNVLKLRGICFGEDDLPMILLPYELKRGKSRYRAKH